MGCAHRGLFNLCQTHPTAALIAGNADLGMAPSVMNCWSAKGVIAQVPLAVELIQPPLVVELWIPAVLWLPLVDGLRLLPQDATTSVACGDDTALTSHFSRRVPGPGPPKPDEMQPVGSHDSCPLPVDTPEKKGVDTGDWGHKYSILSHPTPVRITLSCPLHQIEPYFCW